MKIQQARHRNLDFGGVPGGGDAALADAVDNLGQTISRIGDLHTQEVAQKMERDDRLRRSTQQIRAETEFDGGISGILRDMPGEDGFVDMSVEELRTAYNDRSSKIRSAALKDLKFDSDDERDLMAAKLEQAEAQGLEQIIGAHSKMTLERTNQQWAGIVNTGASAIYESPDMLLAQIVDMSEKATAHVEALGEASVQGTVDATTVTYVQAAVKGLINQERFEEARALIENGVEDPETGALINFDSLLTVGNREKFDAAIDGAEAAAKAEDQQEALSEFLIAARHVDGEEAVTKLADQMDSLEKTLTPRQLVAADAALVSAAGRVERTKDAMLKEMEEAEEAALKQHQAEVSANLGVAVSRAGSVDDVVVLRDALKSARETGTITPSRWETLTKNLDNREGEVLEAEISMNKANMALSGMPFDPADKELQKGFDAIWNAGYAPRLAGEGIAQMPAAVAEFTQRTGYVPEGVKAFIRASEQSENLAMQAVAAQTVYALGQQGKLGGFKTKDIARSLLAGKYMAMMLPADEALKRARQMTDPSNKDLHALREKEIKDFREDFAGEIDDVFDVDLTPNVRGPVLIDYEESFRSWYLKTGDEEIAKQQANDDITRKWGVTRVEGNERLMAHPPEIRYSVHNDPDLDAEWQREQLHGDLLEGILWDKDGVDMDRVRLQFVPGTREAPLYHVLLERDGVWTPVVDAESKDGLLRWVPDWESSKAKERAENEQAELVAKGKEARQRMQEYHDRLKQDTEYENALRP